jgi:hypothetical protein
MQRKEGIKKMRIFLAFRLLVFFGKNLEKRRRRRRKHHKSQMSC